METAGGKNGKPEAELTAVTRLAADEIEIQMKQAKQMGHSMEDGQEASLEESQLLFTRCIRKSYYY